MSGVLFDTRSVLGFNAPNVVINDGGRAAAGFKGTAGDCVVRAIAIATQRPYCEVYDAIFEVAKTERGHKTRRGGKAKSSPRNGVYKSTIKRYLDSLGWKWQPTMQIGSGTMIHLRQGELPMGRLIVSVSRHLVAVIDGEVHDTFDCTRSGMRAVYGIWYDRKTVLDIPGTRVWQSIIMHGMILN